MAMKPYFLAIFSSAALASTGCATVDTTQLGENKQEFEQYAKGGNYRFQYVAEGSDGYRTILWRQGESLSDDGRDGTLVAGVVESVFRERFCKELNLPTTLAAGSPAPLGKEGKWTATLRCAEPPPPPPKPTPAKKKGKPKPDTVAKKKSDKPVASSSSTIDARPKPKPAAKQASSDGPVVCEADGAGGFNCKPKR